MAVNVGYADFGRRMRARTALVRQNAPVITQYAALAIGDALIDGTPVDTGETRSNWQATLTSPANTVIPPYAPGRHLGINESANAAAAKSALRRVVALYRGGSLWITNPSPVAAILNRGSSAQAPAGFVETALVRGRVRIRALELIQQRLAPPPGL